MAVPTIVFLYVCLMLHLQTRIFRRSHTLSWASIHVSCRLHLSVLHFVFDCFLSYVICKIKRNIFFTPLFIFLFLFIILSSQTPVSWTAVLSFVTSTDDWASSVEALYLSFLEMTPWPVLTLFCKQINQCFVHGCASLWCQDLANKKKLAACRSVIALIFNGKGVYDWY